MKHIVFHIISKFDLGGAEKVAVNLASSLNDEYNFHLIEVAKAQGEFSESFIKELRNRKILFHRAFVKNTKLGIIVFPFRMLFLACRYRPIIIHSHTEVPDLSVFLFFSLFGWGFRKTRYVRTIHNTQLWNQWHTLGIRVERFFIKHHSNISISKSVQESYKHNYGEEPPIILNGVEEVAQRDFNDINHSKKNVLFAGRLEEQKGVDILMEVIEKGQGIKNLDFWIIGSGSMAGPVIERVGKFPWVHYRPKVFGLSHYLSSFDYLFMPSRFEGLSLMSIEASLAGLPAIINNCPGLSDTFPQDWPLKVSDNRVDNYLTILSDLGSYDRNSLGKLAYAFAKSHFSIEQMQEGYERFYKLLIKNLQI